MHRRVAHTVAAVIPRTYSTERLARLQDPARVVAEETNYYGTEDIYVPRQESSDLSYSGYDLTTHDDNERHHWRRLDSRGESILSGLDGPGEEEHDRLRRSPESMREGVSLNRVAEEDADPSGPTDPIDPQLEPEDVEEAIEWELEENGLYGGGCWLDICLGFSMTPPSRLSPRIIQATIGIVYIRAIVSVDHLCSARCTASSRMASSKLAVSISTTLPLPSPRDSPIVGYVCTSPPAACPSLHRVVASPTPRHRLASSHLLTRVARKPLAPRVPGTAACPSQYG